MIAFRKPTEVLEGLIAGGAEALRSQDPRLAAALDVSPPLIESPVLPVLPNRRLIYRGLRKVYRVMLYFGPLRPVLRATKELLFQFKNGK